MLTEAMAVAFLFGTMFSPIVVFVISICIVAHAWRTRKRVAFLYLLGRTLTHGFLFVLASLILLILWMRSYEASAGSSAGNAPAAWIFFLAPLAFAVGQVLALADWWFRRIRQSE